MKTLIATSVACVLFLLGCAPRVHVAPFGPGPLPNEPKLGDIDVYASEESVTKPWREIASIAVDNYLRFMQSPAELRECLMLKAKEVGADGVIILFEGKVPANDPRVAGRRLRFVRGEIDLIRGVAIIYR